MNGEAISGVLRAGVFGGASTAVVGGTLSETFILGLLGFIVAIVSALGGVWHNHQMRKIARERMDREFPPSVVLMDDKRKDAG